MAVVRVAVESGLKCLNGVLLGALWLGGVGGMLLVSVESADAQVRYASSKRSNAAIAHYARARAMCVETLEEFEVGRKHARPDLLLDAEEWRLTMISLCEQLNRLVDPKIRVSNEGIQVNANPRLISRASDKLPEVADGPKSRSDVGEAARLKEKQDARARMYAPQDTDSAAADETTAAIDELEAELTDGAPELEVENQLSEEELIEQAIQEAIISSDDGYDESAAQDSQFDEANYDPALPTPQDVVEEETSARPDLARQAAQVEREIEQRIQAQDAQRQLPVHDELDPEDLYLEDDTETQTEVREILDADEDLSAGEAEPINGEDAKIASAIEQAIQDKLREIEEAGSAGNVTPTDPEEYDGE